MVETSELIETVLNDKNAMIDIGYTDTYRRSLKSRFEKGNLSLTVQYNLLEKLGYEMKQESKWQLK